MKGNLRNYQCVLNPYKSIFESCLPLSKRLFIAEEKSDFNEKKLELLKELLLDFWVDIEVVWREPYGVVGDGETMKINHITVY